MLYLLGSVIASDFFPVLPVISTYILLFSIIAWTVYGGYKGKFSLGISKKTAVLLSVILLFSAAVRVYAPERFGALGGDELGYVAVADNIAENGRYTTGDETYFKPYYLFIHITAPLTYFFSSVAAGRIVNLFLSLLTVLAVYGLGKKFYGEKTGVLAALFFSFLPSNIHLSNTTESMVASTLAFLIFVTVFGVYLEKGGLFWGMGSTMFLASLVIARSVNWVFFPFFTVILVFRKGLRKEYLLYGIIFMLFTCISFLHNIPMGFRGGGGEISHFAMNHAVNNGLNFFQNLLTNLHYVPLFLFGFAGIIKALRHESRDITVFSSLMFFSVMLSYKYFQAYFLSKEYYLFSVMLTVFAAFAVKDYVGFEGFKTVSIVLILVLGAFNVYAAFSYDEETLLPTTKEFLEFKNREYPSCLLITQDPRPVMAVSDIPYTLVYEDNRSLNWYERRLGADCLFYYNYRRNLPDYISDFERKHLADKEPVLIVEDEFWDFNAYVLNLEGEG